jgi:hypothetical protein
MGRHHKGSRRRANNKFKPTTLNKSEQSIHHSVPPLPFLQRVWNKVTDDPIKAISRVANLVYLLEKLDKVVEGFKIFEGL